MTKEKDPGSGAVLPFPYDKGPVLEHLRRTRAELATAEGWAGAGCLIEVVGHEGELGQAEALAIIDATIFRLEVELGIRPATGGGVESIAVARARRLWDPGRRR